MILSECPQRDSNQTATDDLVVLCHTRQRADQIKAQLAAWLPRFTPLSVDAARPLRHATGDRWFVDETYVKVAGRWRYLCEADHARLKARSRPMRGLEQNLGRKQGGSP